MASLKKGAYVATIISLGVAIIGLGVTIFHSRTGDNVVLAQTSQNISGDNTGVVGGTVNNRGKINNDSRHNTKTVNTSEIHNTTNQSQTTNKSRNTTVCNNTQGKNSVTICQAEGDINFNMGK